MFNIEIKQNRKFIENYLSDIATISQEISVAEIDKVIDILFEAWANGRQVFTCGNGGSSSTATHFYCDLAKQTIVDGKKRFRAICLNDNIPLMSALTNDNGFDNLYYEQLLNLFQEGDVLITISVHGGVGSDKAGAWSQNLIKAIRYVQDNGGKAIGFSGFDGGLMKEICDACIVVPANSTPHVESFHLALEHLICSCLKKKIEES